VIASARPQSNLHRAVKGAIAGAIGVWALDRLDWFLYNRMSQSDRARTRAARPNGEPPAQALITKLAEATDIELSDSTHATVSEIVHYAIGIAPAVGYALARDRLPVQGIARGAAYGAALFALQDEGLNTITKLGGSPGDYPRQDHARGLAAHLLYGAVTEAALNAMEAFEERGEDNRLAQVEPA
jgi:uncharacterized membrane protein YagU involved in acid resistance